MAARRQRVLLSGIVALLGGSGAAAEERRDSAWLENTPLATLEQERREVRLDDIDSEDFEISLRAGVLAVEDFGSDQSIGATANYHVTEDFFLEGVYARSRLGLTSFETLSGGARLFTDDERDLTHYGINVGWDVLPGEAYIGRWRAVNTAFYVVGGVGATEFGGDDRFTVTLGFGYRVLATDWLAWHVDVRDLLFDSDVLGTDKTTNNLQLSTGLSIFF
jgi:outer membrane beta-barrel protein